MPLDAGAVRRGCRGAEVKTASQLCRAELERFRAAVSARPAADCRLHTGSAAVRKKRPATANAANITFVNVRETAGWSRAGRRCRAQNGGA